MCRPLRHKNLTVLSTDTRDLMIRHLLRFSLVPFASMWLSLFAPHVYADGDVNVFASSGNDLLDLNLTQLSSQTATSLAATATVIAARQSDGRIYGYAGTSIGYLFFWDPATDTFTQVRSYSGSRRLDPARMGFAADGTLYISDSTERLYTIDTQTGTVTLLGTMSGLATGPYDATGDLGFAADGTLYIVNYQSLYTIDLATLAATEVSSGMISSPSLASVAVWSGLAFCDGQMYASSVELRSSQAGPVSGLYTIDLQTGSDAFLYDAPGQLSDLADCTSAPVGGLNTAPVADSQLLNTNIDLPLSITLQAQDADNDILNFTVLTQPANGTLAGTGNNLTYTPNSGYSGGDIFTFEANDGQLRSAPETVEIQVGGPAGSDLILYGANAYGRDQMIELNVTQRTPTVVANLPFGTQAIARDPDNGFIYFYEWQASGSRFAYWNPADGQFTIVRTYSPINGFYAKRMDFAPDGTLYLSDDQEGLYIIDKVSGDVTGLGTVTGLEQGIWEATGDMTFTPDGTFWVSNYRTLSTINLETLEATAVFTNLVGTAPLIPYEDAVLTGIAFCDGAFYTTSAEQVTGQSAVFRVDATTGAETFLFYAQAILNDITSCSTDSFPSNIAPVTGDLIASTLHGQTVELSLQATDADGDALVLSIYDSPENGTLSGDGTSFTYTPSVGFEGEDSFRYIATDGLATSNIATAVISVLPPETTPVNTAPVAQPQSLVTLQDIALPITLTGTDSDADLLSFSIVSQPLNGTLTGSADGYAYTPAGGFTGADSFEFLVNDGQLDSNIATVSLQVDTAVTENRAPEAFAQQVFTLQDQSLSIALDASDPENDPLSFVVVSLPTNGTLTGSAATLTYTPSNGFVGTDSFTFIANDGDIDSDFAVININVDPSTVLPQGIFGTNGAGDVYGFNLAQLTASNTGSLPFGSSAIALDPSTNRLFFYGGNAQQFLAYRDPVTGNAVQIQSYQGADRLEAVRMDFAPDGTLYLSDESERLYTLDTQTGAVTLLGTMSGLGTGPYDATGDMLFAADGTLWMANYRSLYTVDLATLAATEVFSDMVSTSGASDVALWSGLALCNGQVFGSSVELRGGQSTPISGFFTIDLQTGADTFLFDAPSQINDLSSCN